MRHGVVWLGSRQGRRVFATTGGRASRRVADAGGLVVAFIERRALLHILQKMLHPPLVEIARNGLSRRMPEFAARQRVTRQQAVTGTMLLLATAAAWIARPVVVEMVLFACLCALFLGVVALRACSLFDHRRSGTVLAPPLPRERLPTYSVLVPLLEETAVADQLIGALLALDYPADRLDVKLVLEERDHRMRRHIAARRLPEHFEVLTVPHALPQTKPKALNYALQFARGRLIVVFDAEDIPERDQLLRAAAAFRKVPRNVVCLQASLAYYNANENWLTRQFAIEYAALFDLLLPMLCALRLPFPLGGTSNHFKTAALRRLGGWDAHNVTEDADIGFRLARFGWRAAVLRSTTYEEANCRLGNWLRQRARWIKGWIQTWLVHNRDPVRLWRELGPGGFITVQVTMAGIIVSALAHPLFLALVVWSAARGALVEPGLGLTGSMLAGASMVVLAAGYGITMLAGWRATRVRGLAGLGLSVLGMPLYWLLISLGGWLAVAQFVFQPFHWNKTRHGLSRFFGRRRVSPRRCPRPTDPAARR